MSLEQEPQAIPAQEEKELKDAFLAKADAFEQGIKDKSFNSLKEQLKGYKIKGGFDDGRGHSGASAAGYAKAIMAAPLSDAEKRELLQDVEKGMSGFSGDYASEIIDGYKKELDEKQNSVENINLNTLEDQAHTDLAMLLIAGKDLQYSGKSDAIGTLQKTIANLPEEAQVHLAQEYFDKTIGTDISSNKYAYPVYQSLKGTAFGEKFAALENARLKEAGYPGFTL